MYAMNTKVEVAGWSRRYQTALRRFVQQGPSVTVRPALRLGRQAVTLGLETLDLAVIHKQVLTALMAPGGALSRPTQALVARAKRFFNETLVPIEKTHNAALTANVRVSQLTRALNRRTAQSSASTRSLQRNIRLRQGAEQTLRTSGQRNARHRAELQRLQNHLRDLTRTCLSTVEGERQRMSLRLQNELAQSLIAIDLRLLTLKKAARTSTAGLKKEIASTRRLVKESTLMIRRFVHGNGIQHEA